MKQGEIKKGFRNFSVCICKQIIKKYCAGRHLLSQSDLDASLTFTLRSRSRAVRIRLGTEIQHSPSQCEAICIKRLLFPIRPARYEQSLPAMFHQPKHSHSNKAGGRLTEVLGFRGEKKEKNNVLDSNLIRSVFSLRSIQVGHFTGNSLVIKSWLRKGVSKLISAAGTLLW